MEDHVFNNNDTSMRGLLKQYIVNNTFKSVNQSEWKRDFEIFVDANYDWGNATYIKEKMKWNTWVMNPGVPVDNIDFMTPEVIEALNLADGYISKNGKGSPSNATKFLEWENN